MTRHALVIGAALEAPAQRLSAQEADAARMAEMLRGRDFEVEVLTGTGATREGILAGYRRLIERAEPGEAAVVYFHCHGGMRIDAAASGEDRAAPERFQFIAPTDYSQITEDDFRGISAWELSQLLRELTDRTRNVAVILDCCYAAQMSREGAAGAAARPRPGLTWLGIGRHFDAVRARFGPIDGPGVQGNPDAVRVAACGEWQTALETLDDQGQPTGVLTRALLAVLAEVGDAPVSWRAIGDAVRIRVQRTHTTQRPLVEGPVNRRLFSLDEVPTATSIPIAEQGGGLRLGAGMLAGVSAGDVYGVTRLGAEGLSSETEIARVQVEDVKALHAIARPVEQRGGIPPEAVAWPIELAIARHGVWIDAPERERVKLEAAIARSRRLQVAAAREGVVGQLCMRGGEMLVLLRDGRSLAPPSTPRWSVEDAIAQLDQLAAAQTLLELEGGHGLEETGAEGALAETDVEVEWGTVHPGGVLVPRPSHGAAVSLGDRIYLRVRNRSQGQRFAHVFNIGLRGRIKLLSAYAPAGIRLAPRPEPGSQLARKAEAVVPDIQDRSSQTNGYSVSWPPGMPSSEPATDTLIVLVTEQPVELRMLETPKAGGHEKIGVWKSLQYLMNQLHEGGTRSTAEDPFVVVRRTYELYPLRAPMAGRRFAFEPCLAIGAGAGEAREIEIRLRGLAVAAGEPAGEESRGAFRIDALVCTRGADRAHVYEARTLDGATARDGDLLWRGRVQDFVDIHLWIGARGGARSLAEMLESAVATLPLAEALDALIVHPSRAPGAPAGEEIDRAPWRLAGAAAALAQAAGELLRAAAPETAGLLHVAFTAAEGYGLGRHAASGLYRAHGVELGLSVEAA